MSKFSVQNKGLQELQSRVIFVLVGVLVFRIGVHLPIPGVDLDQLNHIFQQNQGNMILGYFDLFSGGALSNMSLLTLGIAPYITASIALQLLSYSLPVLQELRKEGESGRQKMNQYTRYLTLLLSLIQGMGVTQFLISNQMIIIPASEFYFLSALSLSTGTMFLMWLGDQMTRNGIGNGISILIFSGIVSRFPEAIAKLFSQVRQGQVHAFTLLLVFAIIVSVIVFVVCMERGQRQLPLTYPKRQQAGGRNMSQNNSRLPLKINMVGVLPPIIATALISFPLAAAEFFSRSGSLPWLPRLSFYLQPGEPLYMLLFVGLVLLFSYYLTAVLYNTDDIADQLKRGGALIGGVRPGIQTALHIDKILSKLTLFGGLYLSFVAVLPDIVIRFLHIPMTFGGTSLLIAVVVVIEIMSQLQTYLIPGHMDRMNQKKGGQLKLLR